MKAVSVIAIIIAALIATFAMTMAQSEPKQIDLNIFTVSRVSEFYPSLTFEIYDIPNKRREYLISFTIDNFEVRTEGKNPTQMAIECVDQDLSDSYTTELTYDITKRQGNRFVDVPLKFMVEGKTLNDHRAKITIPVSSITNPVTISDVRIVAKDFDDEVYIAKQNSFTLEHSPSVGRMTMVFLDSTLSTKSYRKSHRAFSILTTVGASDLYTISGSAWVLRANVTGLTVDTTHGDGKCTWLLNDKELGQETIKSGSIIEQYDVASLSVPYHGNKLKEGDKIAIRCWQVDIKIPDGLQDQYINWQITRTLPRDREITVDSFKQREFFRDDGHGEGSDDDDDDVDPPKPGPDPKPDPKPTPDNRTFFQRFRWFIAIVVIVLIGVGGFFAWKQYTKNQQPQQYSVQMDTGYGYSQQQQGQYGQYVQPQYPQQQV